MTAVRTSLTAIALLIGAGCGGHEQQAAEDGHGAEIGVYASFPLRHGSGFPEPDPQATVADMPPFESEDIFPCVDCHDPDFMEVDPTPRELGEPHDVMPEFAHAPHRLWCLDCHDAEDRDMLKLASGATLPFEEAPQLCGQCHGEQHKDWIAGAHGLRTGYWNGEKTVQPCAACHDAHSPLFKPIAPMPGPKKPETTR
jgi:hypothetical protein